MRLKIDSSRMLVATLCLCILGGFLWSVEHFSTTFAKLDTSPSVVNLTKAGVKTKIGYGPSPRCGEMDCWARPDLDDSSWDEALLPHDDVRSRPGFAEAVRSGTMYYRLAIKIPERLLVHREVIAFTPSYVSHERYEFFLNGRPVFVSNGAYGPGKVAVIPIPKNDATDGVVKLAIKATVGQDDYGMKNRAAFYLGPKRLLDEMHLFGERSGYTYRLLFLLTQGGVFMIFALLFFFVESQRRVFFFLLFTFAGMLEHVMIGDFVMGELSLAARAMSTFTLRVLGLIFLIIFLRQELQLGPIRNVHKAAAAIYLALVMGLGFDFGWGTRQITLEQLFLLTNSVLVGSIICTLGMAAWARWMGPNGGRNSPTEVKALMGFLTAYCACLMWEFYLKRYTGFDRKPLYDLAFFFLLAFTAARSFRVNEKVIADQVRQLSDAQTKIAVAEAAQQLAHDARKPLSMVRTFVRVLDEHRNLAPEVVARFRTEIDTAVASFDSMAADVMEAGSGSQLILESVDPKALVASSMAQLRLMHPEIKQIISTRLQHCNRILAHSRKLERVLLNLLENALDACPPGGRIWVTTKSRDDETIEFVVGNSGSYIEPRDQLKLFDAYFTRGKRNGTGLGLAISRKIVQAHGGSIECRSSRVTGTEFLFCIPATRGLIDATTVKEGERPRVAIVDDNHFFLDAWRMSMTDAEVTTFESPEAFWRHFDMPEEHVEGLSCVVTDLYFGSKSSGDGVDFAKAIKARYDFPVALCSDSSGLQTGSRHVDLVIPKEPMTWNGLRAALSQARKA